MPNSPFQSWLSVQEHKRAHFVFLIEWLSIFVLAWFFWSVLFFGAPGAVSPGLAASILAALYASCIIYGRLLSVTGCRKCSNPMPFMRKEIGRRHLRDEEHCMEIQYGSEEYGQELIQVYSKVSRNDIVTYRCRKCGQVWEEKVELSGTGYRLVRRIDKDD